MTLTNRILDKSIQIQKGTCYEAMKCVQNQENESRGLKVKRMDFLILWRSTEIGKTPEKLAGNVPLYIFVLSLSKLTKLSYSFCCTFYTDVKHAFLVVRLVFSGWATKLVFLKCTVKEFLVRQGYDGDRVSEWQSLVWEVSVSRCHTVRILLSSNSF